YYPPALTGLRASHDDGWATMHARVAGKGWNAGPPTEEHDVMVVGAGNSGQAAAWRCRQQHPDASTLVPRQHAASGGQAKRNEFRVGGRTRIGYGGTEAIDTPSSYGRPAMELLEKIGIRLDAFHQAYDASIYSSLGLSRGILFDQANFGRQQLAVGYGAL